MPAKDILDILVYVSAIAVAITVGRTNIKKQTIADLQALTMTHEQTILSLRTQNAEQAEEIRELKETINGYSELVREGYLAGFGGRGSGNSPASPKVAKNRTS